MASDFENRIRYIRCFRPRSRKKCGRFRCGTFCFWKGIGADFQEGIKTIGDMARSGEAELKRILGEKAGHQLYRYANGIDDSPVREREEAKGYSAETTVEEDLVTYEQALALLLAQCDVVAARMRRDGKKCSCVAVTYRTLDFKTRSHQRAFEDPTDVTDEIFAQVKKLLYECWK